MNVKNGKLLNYFEKERNIENMLNYVLSNQNKQSLRNLKSRVVSFSTKSKWFFIKTQESINAKKLINSISLKKTKKMKKNKVKAQNW